MRSKMISNENSSYYESMLSFGYAIFQGEGG